MMNRDFMFRTEAQKASAVGATLGRMWIRFKAYNHVLLAVALLIILSTYIQVTIPDLLGQAVDCYLSPATVSALAQANGVDVPSTVSTNCWFARVYPRASTANYAVGLGQLVLLIAVLYIISSILTGLQFFLMTYVGQNVLRGLRVEVFSHI